MNFQHHCFILLGTNLGDRFRNLQVAEQWIGKLIGTIEKKSSTYETAPWGKTDQSAFLNNVLLVATPWKPEKVMETLLSIEGMMGRERKEKWEPRIIDLDILFFDQLIMDSPLLTLPHPHLQDRRFVLQPLMEVAPDLRHPGMGMTVQQLFDQCRDPLAVKKVGEEPVQA